MSVMLATATAAAAAATALRLYKQRCSDRYITLDVDWILDHTYLLSYIFYLLKLSNVTSHMHNYIHCPSASVPKP